MITIAKNKIKLCIFAMLLTFTWSSALAQNISVSGVVTDKSGPVIGAQVIVKGASNGGVTDVTGKYTISSAPAKGTLVISMMGYATKEVPINNQKVINVSLEESSEMLDEVIVVGYGVMKKRDVTGAISSIGNKDIESNAPQNIGQALQGKVSGVTIMTSSEPGSESTMSIRGASSIQGGSSPLFIVDGMEVANINDINPRDIQSMEVLKDAASAAIYGSRSANGVIIVTTKQGQSGKPQVNVTYSYKISKTSNRLYQMNRSEGVDYERLRNYLDGYSTTIANRDSLNPGFTADNYYQGLIFRQAPTHEVAVSISGAENKLKYFISAGYLDQQGIQINTNSNRINTRINTSYQATPKFKATSNVAISLTDTRKGHGTGRSTAALLGRPANMSVYEPDGSVTPVLADRPNPLAYSIFAKDLQKIWSYDLKETFEYKILKNLIFTTSMAANFRQDQRREFVPGKLVANQKASSRSNEYTNFNWTHEDILSYSQTFNKDHSMNLMAGFSMQDWSQDNVSVAVTDNFSESMHLSYAYANVNMNNTYAKTTKNRMASIFARGSYSYKGKYMLNATARYDGSSRFGANKRWGMFPSVSLAWRLSDESFMQWAKPFLADAKVRLSYGVTGNQSAGNFASLGLFNAGYYADYVSVSPGQLESKDLGWESTTQYNAGIDLSFLENRIAVSFDIYQKKTEDVLYQVALPQTTGFANSYQNMGNLDNKGIEFSITSTNIRTKDFEWSTTLNLGFNKNTITSVPPGGRIYANTVYIIDKGFPLGTMFGYKARGIFPYTQSNAFQVDYAADGTTPVKWNQLTPIYDEKMRFVKYQLDGKDYDGEVRQLKYSTVTGPEFKGGDVFWDDLDKNGIIDANDRQVIGEGQPKVVGGFNTEFNWKGISLSAFFTFAIGGDVYMSGYVGLSEHKWSAMTRASQMNVSNAWKAEGDIAKYPRPSNGNGVNKSTVAVDNTRNTSSLWIEDGSYIRLKNLRLAYTLPEKIVKKLRLSNVQVYAMAQNYFTWTNYQGYDPEIPASGYSIGRDNNAYPQSRDLLFGININF